MAGPFTVVDGVGIITLDTIYPPPVDTTSVYFYEMLDPPEDASLYPPPTLVPISELPTLAEWESHWNTNIVGYSIAYGTVTTSPRQTVVGGNAYNRIWLSSPTQLGNGIKYDVWYRFRWSALPVALNTYPESSVSLPYASIEDYGTGPWSVDSWDFRWVRLSVAAPPEYGPQYATDEFEEYASIGSTVGGGTWELNFRGAYAGSAATQNVEVTVGMGADHVTTTLHLDSDRWHMAVLQMDPQNGIAKFVIWPEDEPRPTWQLQVSGYPTQAAPSMLDLSMSCRLGSTAPLFGWRSEWDIITIGNETVSDTAVVTKHEPLWGWYTEIVDVSSNGVFTSTFPATRGFFAVWVDGVRLTSGQDWELIGGSTSSTSTKWQYQLSPFYMATHSVPSRVTLTYLVDAPAIPHGWQVPKRTIRTDVRLDGEYPPTVRGID